jgi:hypothetical protein
MSKYKHDTKEEVLDSLTAPAVLPLRLYAKRWLGVVVTVWNE